MSARALLQLTSEFGPLVAFLLAGQLTTFIGAVWVLLIATIVSVCYTLLAHRQLPWLPIASAIVAVASAIATLAFNKPDAIIFADTAYYWGFAIAIYIGFFRSQHFLEHIFSSTFAITRAGWQVLSRQWFALLIIAGLSNEFVRLTMTPEFWLDYRASKIGLLALFAILQLLVARWYRIPGESTRWGVRLSQPKNGAS